MSDSVVSLTNVYKKFGLSLKNALRYGLADSLSILSSRDYGHDLRDGEFWAVEGVSFRLEKGDALGILGVNGSGKTTLLRMLNGTFLPDRGNIRMMGSVGALIAAGAGFSPMLSGRENIYISGSLLGMTPREIEKSLDAIIDFSELAEFIDMPVRNYSSGMSVRLGFAIAVIGKPDILLVDEVLAVGDLRFQKKCFNRIKELRDGGTTILLVSHSPGAIWAVCNKAIHMKRGISTNTINVEDAIRLYDEENMKSRTIDLENMRTGQSRDDTGEIVVSGVEVYEVGSNECGSISFGCDLVIQVYIKCFTPIDDVIIRLQINSEVHRPVAIVDSVESGAQPYSFNEGEHKLSVMIKKCCLRPGVYTVGPSLLQRTVGVHIYYDFTACSFTVRHPEDLFLYADPMASTHLNSSFKRVD